ncbi:hypothetical protein C8R47DRAFT_1221103 [Mycena vitilis]|nr:hypothetical protein C8R47DRAFT_1221103 [Mycena vitilis]
MLFKANSILIAIFALVVHASATAETAQSSVNMMRNISRSIGNFSVTAVAPCEPDLNTCEAFCDTDANQAESYHSDCYEDCQDDLCDFGKVELAAFEFPLGSGTLTNFSAFRDMSRDTKLASYSALRVHADPDDLLLSFCDGCRTVEDWAALTGRPSPKGIIALLALKLTCALACAAGL